MARKASVGVDVGGTFTDIVVADPGGFHVLKVPTSSVPASAVARGLTKMGPRARQASLICHATTLATNALLTRKGLGRAALVTNEGFRDVLEIGRQRRPELYDLSTRRPPPLVPRADRLTLRCRVDARGMELLPIDPGALKNLSLLIAGAGYDSVAVSFLNSYLNGVHEAAVRDALRARGFRGRVCLSSEVDREYREYERTSTTVVNAVLSPLMTGYLSSLESTLRSSGVDAPVYVMNSDGGSSTLSFASSRPVTVIESGPAAGVVASTELCRHLSLDRALTFDMGGTTAKAGAIVDGEPDIVNEFEAAGRSHSGRSIRGSGYPVRGPFIDLAEVSAGGGTIARVDEAGDLSVGPESAGSDPGPACYGKGGTDATVTDANVVLGRLSPTSLLGGWMTISRPLAAKAIEALAKSLGDASPEQAAQGILRLANSEMARAMSMVSLERGRDPRDFTLIAFGGAGPGHACDLADELGVEQIFIPVHPGLFSAYGLIAGRLTRTFTAPVMESNPRLGGRFRDLEESSREEMRSEGFRRFTIERFAEARYFGQSHELLIPIRGGTSLRHSFDHKHEALFGYSSPDPIEVVNVLVRASVPRSPIPPPGQTSRRARRVTKRRAWIGGSFSEAKVLRRESLAMGEKGEGPCIVEEYDSTLVVNPSWTWTVGKYGMRLER